MDDEVHLSMSLPLDEDGFLRRQCPTCEREFKWRADDAGDDEEDVEATPVDEDGYFCPYCGVQAPTGDWHTEQQIADAKAIVMRDVLSPEIKKLERSIGKLNRSGGFIKAEMEFDMPDEPESAGEDITMRRVD